MTITEKQQIRELTLKKLDRLSISAKHYSKQVGVAASTITALKNGEWEKLSDKMMLKLAVGCDFSLKKWKIAEINNLNSIVTFCTDAQKHSISLGISHNAGSGKTAGYKHYSDNVPNVIYLECADHWTKRVFMDKLLQALGIEGDGYKVYEKAELAIQALKLMKDPLVIFDEADKLKEGPFLFFIELYNKLDGYVGFIISGAPYLRNTVEKNARRDKKGYKEFYSRIGRRFIHLDKISKDDVTSICKTNGIKDQATINEIFNESIDDTGNCDLRRVKRSVLREKMTNTPDHD